MEKRAGEARERCQNAVRYAASGQPQSVTTYFLLKTNVGEKEPRGSHCVETEQGRVQGGLFHWSDL